jgi:hypothetical protein
MSKGGGTTVQTQSIDPDLKKAYLENVQQGRNVAGALGYKQFAGFNPMYQAGEQQLVNTSLTPFTGETIAQFQNPYEQQVVEQSMQDIEKQRQLADISERGKATAARAFGGSRQGVAQGMLDEAALRESARTTSGLRQAGYRDASQLAQYARQQALQGGQTVLGLGGTRQAFEQAQLDAVRNLGLEKLGISSAGLGINLPNLGMTTESPNYRNYGTSALGGALAGASLGKAIPSLGTGYGAGIGALLGLLG